MTLRRTLQHKLAQSPNLYHWILRTTGKGSIEKRHYIQLIRRGDTVFDIGANFGDFTVLFSDLVGQEGAVYSFEPVPPTFARLSDRIRQEARFSNITTIAKACSHELGTAQMTVPNGDLGQASLHSHSLGSWAAGNNSETFSVPTVCLDDYVAEQGISRLDFIKCDAEGAEPMVLSGAVGTLKRFQPILHLEIAEEWLRDFGHSSADLVDIVEDAEYSEFLIEDARVPLQELRGRLRKVPVYSVNLLCATNKRASQFNVF